MIYREYFECLRGLFDAYERTWRTLKYEWVFLREYGSIEELEGSLGEFVEFFNSRRIHQGLDYMTPDEVYRQGTFSDAEE